MKLSPSFLNLAPIARFIYFCIMHLLRRTAVNDKRLWLIFGLCSAGAGRWYILGTFSFCESISIAINASAHSPYEDDRIGPQRLANAVNKNTLNCGNNWAPATSPWIAVSGVKTAEGRIQMRDSFISLYVHFATLYLSFSLWSCEMRI